MGVELFGFVFLGYCCFLLVNCLGFAFLVGLFVCLCLLLLFWLWFGVFFCFLFSLFTYISSRLSLVIGRGERLNSK